MTGHRLTAQRRALARHLPLLIRTALHRHVFSLRVFVFIGHFGVALAAKKVAPRTSLGTLVMAAQFVDLLWPIFLLLGMERVIIAPGTRRSLRWISSITLSPTACWRISGGLAFSQVSTKWLNGTRGEPSACGSSLISHWMLDALSHRPDLPLYPGSSTYVGLGLWNSRFGRSLLKVDFPHRREALCQSHPRRATASVPSPSGSLSPCCYLIYLLNFLARRPPARRPSPSLPSACGCSSSGPTGLTAIGCRALRPPGRRS